MPEEDQREKNFLGKSESSRKVGPSSFTRGHRRRDQPFFNLVLLVAEPLADGEERTRAAHPNRRLLPESLLQRPITGGSLNVDRRRWAPHRFRFTHRRQRRLTKGSGSVIPPPSTNSLKTASVLHACYLEYG
ncbi:hypothetical protein MRB53_029056 [Persea americana]|uniref:Uncharacterized protein n=1 Tax=Persea americana TaxID=3435 RepID=A0ACC2KHM5_PERAE|nr:hypothetical protein MRB53_029056 [Persea americana]